MTILHHLKTPRLKKNHTLQNIVKFQNVKFKRLHSYIRILSKAFESEIKALST